MLGENIFLETESEVRYYCRSFSAIFTNAKDSFIYDREGRQYIDFFSGAGALNYGHNNSKIKKKIIDYLESDGIIHSLDMYTEAKRDFLQKFKEIILVPRSLEYKVQFPGPTGTNAVEAALKLARKVTGRNNVIAFTNAFHGMTLGALAASANQFKRACSGDLLPNVIRMPFDGFFGPSVDTAEYLEKMIFSPGGGCELPAAIIVETVQAEGGLNVATEQWLHKIQELANRHKILLIVDDVQSGCGRVDGFFSFESAGIYPDIVCMSKSISGYGLPMALVLIKPEYDLWAPGEHNGTFRGGNIAFVAASAALDYWDQPSFRSELTSKSEKMVNLLARMQARFYPAISQVRGKGLMQGLMFENYEICKGAAKECFNLGLIIETCGPRGDVVKLMPPITIDDGLLQKGIEKLNSAIEAVLM